MKSLLDTHVSLWFITGDARLPEVMRHGIRDTENEVYLSVVSVWETMVKHQLGKLPLPAPPESYIPVQRERHRIESLAIDEASVACLAKLPPLHRDPFDRMLICQAIRHDLVLATADGAMRGYAVEVPGTPWQRPR
ncbi:type II toxin-antitoxin system VapC family toxin [Sorangium sp. So ce1128]